jgi:hypothetical protein
MKRLMLIALALIASEASAQADAQLRHHLAGVEFEVARDPFSLLRRRIVGGERGE